MRWPKGLAGLCFGGDWNPEQWPEPVWHQDVALMRQAGVNLVSVGVFAWSWLEPEPGRYTFGWLDRALDLLHEAGIRANLATPTASPPPWFSLAHPDALPVTASGVRLSHGSRDTYCAAAPPYREAARRIAAALARRYAGHPALAMWHVHNEYGTRCHCDHVAAAFRHWLRGRYRDLAGLNAAWGSAFWSQHYSGWEQVLPPRATQYRSNPHQALDFRRFWSDQLLAAFREQARLLREATPDVPVTTNFAFGDWVPIDHRRWAGELDLVAVDSYPAGSGIEAEQQAAFLADLARHWAGGRPWLLLEQAPGTLADRGAQVATAPGRMARLTLTHVARGSRGGMFFQWRASAAGAEQFHAGLVPHAGPDSRIFAEAQELGRLLPRLAEVDPGRIAAEVAIGWDAPSWWALQQPHLPSDRLDYLAAVRRAHRALWEVQVTADFADLSGDLSAYRLVLVPCHYLATDRVAGAVRRYVAGGGHLLVWYLSGVAEGSGRIRLGGYPGAFRELLGVRVTEFRPLPPEATVPLRDGGHGTLWSEQVRLAGAEPVRWYAGGGLAGQPAVTRYRYRHRPGDRGGSGGGLAWYVSTELDRDAYRGVVGAALAAAGVATGGLPSGVELVRRRSGEQSWTFALNHTGDPVRVPARGVDLVSGVRIEEAVRLAPGAVAVVRDAANSSGL
jgi:beta-galactosidase